MLSEPPDSSDGAHNPKVEGSNPSPATRKEQVRMSLSLEAPFFYFRSSTGSSTGSADSIWQQSIAAVRDRHSSIGAVGRGLADAPIRGRVSR